MLLCGTCDLPAKAVVYNMTQFNVNHFAYKDMTVCCDRLIIFITANVIIKTYQEQRTPTSIAYTPT